MTKPNSEPGAVPLPGGNAVEDQQTVIKEPSSAPAPGPSIEEQHTVIKEPSSAGGPPPLPTNRVATVRVGGQRTDLPAQNDEATVLKMGSSSDLPKVELPGDVAPSIAPAGAPRPQSTAPQFTPPGGTPVQQPPPLASSGSGVAKRPGESASALNPVKEPTGGKATSQSAFTLPPVSATPAPASKSGSGTGPTPGAGTGASPSAAPTQLTYGTRIHHYEIIKLIGRGGMGSVFLGRDTRLGRRVAIKFLQSTSNDLTKRFILEARTTAACSHDNIVTIYEVDAWQGNPFMVFEYIQGQPFTKLMSDGKPLPVPRAVELMVPVVRALAYAHSQGIVHRDLKPDNIMLTDSGSVKVLDFGIAKVLQGEEKTREAAAESAARPPRAPKVGALDSEEDDTKELTRQGAMMGTLAYMAPEQWGIGVAIDHRADLWAVGIMLFKMLAGKHPLDPLRGQQLMVVGMLNEPMPSLSKIAPEVPRALCDVVDKCLTKHKEKRYADGVSLLRDLEPFLPGRYSREFKIDESPYAGLSSFQEDDADRFFGRGQEVAAMVQRVRERPLMAVVGPSGAGKSSFVRAGLVPSLKRSGEAWESLVTRPGRDPLGALTNLLAPLMGTSGSVADDLNEQKKLMERLAAEPGFAGAVLRARARKEKKNILLFVDQFEELYTLVPDARVRRAFTACLSAIADDATSPIRVILSIRSDFLDRVPEDQRFMAEMNQGLFFLTSPGQDGLRDAIVQPAEMAGYRFESPDIVEDMLSHLAHTQGALPLLQFCASKLWDTRDAARKILTRAAYDSIGGIGGALATHADSVVSRLPPASQPLVRTLFLRLVTSDRTRALVSMEELSELSKDANELQLLVNELVQARLLVVQTGSGVATVEIVHESLIHSWPMLKRWLEESGEDAAFLEQVRTAARQWLQKGEDKDLLWRGELAEEASRFLRRHKGDLPDSQRRFLDAVVDQEQRAARTRRSVMVGAVVFLSLLVAASVVALIVIQSARGEAQERAVAAMVAEAEAKENLAVAQKKEQERAKAAAEAEKAAAELRVKQQELIDALKLAEDAAEEAKVAQKKALTNAFAAFNAKKRAEDAKIRAEEAKARADAARKEVQTLLTKEQERASRLEKQLGSPVIDTLK